jgi:hypothetical protein
MVRPFVGAQPLSLPLPAPPAPHFYFCMLTPPSTSALAISLPLVVLAQWLLMLYLGYKRIQKRTNYHQGRWAFLSSSTYYWRIAPDVLPFKWGWYQRWVQKFKRKRHPHYTKSLTYVAWSPSAFVDAGVGVSCMIGIWPEPRADFLIADPVLFHVRIVPRTLFQYFWSHSDTASRPRPYDVPETCQDVHSSK